MTSEQRKFGVSGLLSLLLGALAATVLLMSQPVNELPLREEAIKPGVAYLHSGQSGGGASWQRKWQSWQTGNAQTVEFSEAEMNVWLQQSWAGPEADSDPWISWDQPNFRISDQDELQIALSFHATPPGYARELPFWSIGRFEDGGSGWGVSNGQAWIGQFPLGKVPVLGSWLASRMVQNAFRANIPEEFQAEVGSYTSVMIENQRVTIRR